MGKTYEVSELGDILIYQNEKGDIYADGELEKDSTCKEFLQVQTEGSRQIKHNKKHYNFRMILAIRYRVRSNVGIHFRN